MEGRYVSNAYLDRSEEGDALVSPELLTGYELGAWEAGYRGRLDWWFSHADLRAHTHLAYVDVASESGEDEPRRDHRLRLEVSSLHNDTALESLDHVTPILRAQSRMDLDPALTLDLDAEAGYRWFFRNESESQVNGAVSAEPGLHLESRTTLLLRLGYAVRYYVGQVAARVPMMRPLPGSPVETEADGQLAHQADVRLRVGQGLLPKLGLRFEHVARWVWPARSTAPQEQGVLPAFLTEDFRFHRERPALSLGWSATEALSAWVEAAYEHRRYVGFVALASDGTPLPSGVDRVDDRVGGSLSVRWRWGDARLGGDLSARYRYEHIDSNAPLYRSQVHEVGLAAGASY